MAFEKVSLKILNDNGQFATPKRMELVQRAIQLAVTVTREQTRSGDNTDNGIEQEMLRRLK